MHELETVLYIQLMHCLEGFINLYLAVMVAGTFIGYKMHVLIGVTMSW